MKTPTKIKARKMHVFSDNAGWMQLREDHGTYTAPVFVLDASRYGEMVELMAKAQFNSIQRPLKWDNASEHGRNFNRRVIIAALRSIGITKGAK